MTIDDLRCPLSGPVSVSRFPVTHDITRSNNIILGLAQPSRKIEYRMVTIDEGLFTPPRDLITAEGIFDKINAE